MLSKLLTSLTLLVVVSSSINAQVKGDKVYDADVLHVLKIYSEDEPNLYELIQQEAFSFFDRPYHLVRMEFDGEVIDSIGIRAKGFFSSIDESQTPMKIDLNEYIDDRTFDGLKKINLTNSFTDQYRQKDRVSYELFRRSGVAGPRTSYTEVYVNDEFINIYLLVEQVDKTFIKGHFADEGSLLKINETIYGDQDFSEMISDFSEVRLSNVNLRTYFKFQLINSIIQAGDNYPNNNFYLHYSDKEDLFQFIPWDYNLCMNSGLGGFESLKPDADGFEIWNDNELKDLYLEVACELKGYLLDGSFVTDLTSSNFSTIMSNSQGAIVEDYVELLDYLLERRQWLGDELNEEGFICEPFSYPYAQGDLVINEFAATSDSIGGIQEPDGGTPDWIELYNNSDEDILLNQNFYLSDDVDFPKKWNFKTDITIPSKGYQIIWADRDVDQQGVHSNFKIEKSQGDLMLVYEDLTIIDQVNYDEQELNMSYARIPNGTGEFVIQEYTFDGNNDMILSTNSLESNSDINVYPNPTPGFIHVITSDRIKRLQVYSASGKLMKQQESSQKSIDISALNTGIYFMHVQTDKQLKVLKIVKGALN